ncbi:MAG TPA: ferrous iron transport protein B [Candidatus Eisenbacteria bacterium]|jgi:ferrous iron transport protein B|nr:ferrous iron transport protein B [Candidatus Eisenbacteria bacterium]
MSKPSERVAIVGSPNSGKSSLFNRLTGLRQKVANYPGVTVEKKVGACELPSGRRLEIVDLPGTYSLAPRSPDEAIVRDALEGRCEPGETPDRVVAVVDATNLERQLYLGLQILATGRPAILVLNLIDAAEAQGIRIDVAAMERILGVPVLAVSAKTGRGIDRLRATLDADAVVAPRENGHGHGNGNGNGHHANGNGGANGNGHRLTLAQALDPARGYQSVEEIVHQVVRRVPGRSPARTRLDRVLTHRVFGPLLFVLFMGAVFQSIYVWAQPAMDALSAAFGALGSAVHAALPAGPVRSLLVDGVIAGAGTVAAFLPQLAILFFFIALMEDTGYMARAAFIMDRVMGAVGLPGRAFLPLLSSFACAIPGIMATRTIENKNDRLTTILIAPLMTCSARLPVYALLIGAFIPNRYVLGIVNLRGLTLLSLYLFGIVVALGTAWVLKRTVLRGSKPLYVMELPPYRMPSWRSVLLTIRNRCLLFMQRAGSVIVAVSLVLWFLASYPVSPAGTPPGKALENSFAGQLGRAIEPAIKPLGFDWKMGVGLISSVAAREVMISTMATVYSLDGSRDPSMSLRETLPKVKDERTGLPVYTPLVAISLMVFFALACQCMSTVAVARRETNSWRWPIFMLVFMNAIAWVASFLVFQGGRMLGIT